MAKMVYCFGCHYEECQYGSTATEAAKKAARERRCPKCGKELDGMEIIGSMISIPGVDAVEAIKEVRERNFDY